MSRDTSTSRSLAHDSESLELRIDSHPANVRPARLAVEHFARSHGMSDKSCDEIGLALNEAMTNVIRHQYGGDISRPIVVRAAWAPDQLRVSIRDFGKPFNPSSLPAKPPEPGCPGGLGLLCIRRCMDDVKFEQLSDGMLLTLVKRHA
jgi:anti-sigma regulatory factor (Ser/Thr protein kinase)